MPKRKQIGHKASVGRPNSFIKKSIITLLGIGVLLYPLICFSSYIIHLKDGREVATDQYWEEADQIKLKKYGGVIGVEKTLIREIEKVQDTEEPPVVKKIPTEPAAGAEMEREEKTEGETAEQKEFEKPEKGKRPERTEEQEKPEASEKERKKAAQKKAAKINAFIEEKWLLQTEKEEARKAYREAKAMKDKEMTQQRFQDLISLRNEIKKLEEKVKGEFGGKLPDWWWD